MIMLIAAAIAAAQIAPAANAAPSTDAHAQHQQIGHRGKMSEEMADCHKCCEEMMAKMHKGHAQHKGMPANG